MKLKDSLVIILAVIIAIVVGVFVGVKLSANIYQELNNNEVIENDETNNNNQEPEEQLTLNDVKKLMDNYLVDDNTYIDSLSSSVKTYLAMQKIDATIYDGNYCDDFFGENYLDDEINEYCGNDGEIYSYSYDTLLKEMKKLFGNSETLEKGYFDYWYNRYSYSSKINSFVNLGSFGGGDSCDYSQTNITNYEVVNGILYIYTEQKNFGCDDNMVSVFKYKYTFKKQDSGYYMDAVE